MRIDDLLALAAELGRPRGGVVLAADLRRAGADPDTVRQAIRTRWQVPVRGVYVLHRDPLTDAELGQVALAHAGPQAVLTGGLVARRAGMRWLPELPGAMALVPAHVRRRGSEGVVLIRRCADLDTLDVRVVDGMPVVPVEQAVVDTCRQLIAVRQTSLGAASSARYRTLWEDFLLRDIRGVVLGAVADKHCSVDQVLARVDAGAMRDSRLVRRACLDAQRGAVSPPEAELVDSLLEAGVPFSCNVEVWRGDVLVAVLDVYLVGTGVGGEMESEEAHGESSLLDATLLRHARVERAGITLRHITPRRHRADPAAFRDELVATARERIARGLGDPPGVRLVPRGPLLYRPRDGRPPYPFTPQVQAYLAERPSAA